MVCPLLFCGDGSAASMCHPPSPEKDERPWWQKEKYRLYDPPAGTEFLDEGFRVFDKVTGELKDTGQTLWDALVLSSDDPANQDAWTRIFRGAEDLYTALNTLSGPSSQEIILAELGINSEIVAERLRNQQAAWGAIGDSIVNSVGEAYERNGAEGAALMVVASLGMELVGGKGAGALNKAADAAKAADNATDAAKAADNATDTSKAKPPKGEDGVVVKKVRNGYTYEFDELGRVSKVEGDLKLNKSQGRNPKAQLEAGGKDRLPGDQGGHFAGRRFDGPTDDFNHFAQNGNFNNGAYRSLENSWQRALERGESVRVEIIPSYPGGSLRPDTITVRQWINGVGQKPITFGNNPGGMLN